MSRAPLSSEVSLVAAGSSGGTEPLATGPSPQVWAVAPALTSLIDRILAISVQRFPGPVTYEEAYDPEDPTDQYLVFNVVADGEYADYRDRELQWHEEVERIAPGSFGKFRLCVMPTR